MSNNYIIYRAFCQVNGKSYIGFTQNFHKRKRSHKNDSQNGSNLYFHKAIRKHGWNNFVWEILHEDHDRHKTLRVKESEFITKYDTFNNGYNMTTGGDGPEEISEETRKKIIDSNKGRIHTDETRKKMSEAAKGRNRSNETRKKISMYAQNMTKEHRKKLSDSAKRWRAERRLKKVL